LDLRHDGATQAEHEFTGKEDTVHKCWSMSAEQYLKLALETIETKLGQKLKYKKADAPIRTDYHLEILTPLTTMTRFIISRWWVFSNG
jgi:hypothetical protein